jgi:YHS domain-containing protein
MSCSVCGKELSENSVKIEKNGVTYNYCCTSCLHNSPELENFKHRSLSSIILNKTLFEVLALITGLGGVYYTIYEAAYSGIHNRALILDTVSVATALIALFMGVEHLRYVEEHDLLKRAIVFLSIIIITGFTMIVWHLGLR